MKTGKDLNKRLRERIPRKAKKVVRKQQAWIDEINRFSKWWNEYKVVEKECSRVFQEVVKEEQEKLRLKNING